MRVAFMVFKYTDSKISGRFFILIKFELVVPPKTYKLNQFKLKLNIFKTTEYLYFWLQREKLIIINRP